MIVLHTSDWHLGARTGGVDRTDDVFARIDELMAVVDERQVDLLLIAGDIFDEYRAERLPRILSRLGSALRSRIDAGLSVVALAGNHDREHVIPMLRTASHLFGVGDGRVVFTERPVVVPVTSRSGSEQLQVVCLPYPTPIRYDLVATSWASREAKHAELATATRRAVAELAEQAERERPGIPTIAAGHLYVRGVTAQLHGMTEAEEVPLERGDLPSYTYVALGHIHRAQALGSEAIRYCGSIERMDRGEAGDQKGALLVQMDGGRLVSVGTVPVNATPFAAVEAKSEADLDAARAEMPEPERTMVSLAITVDHTTPVSAIVARARALFPRLYGTHELRRTSSPKGKAGAHGIEAADVTGTVRSYLATALAGDPDRDAVTALAEELLASSASDLIGRPGALP